MVDIPVTTEDASGIIIYGVESEQIEEENDAYNDMRAELGLNQCFINHFKRVVTFPGIHKDAEDELEELMPSCFCLNVMDCITMKLYHVFKASKG